MSAAPRSRVLITGAGGQVGQELVRVFGERGSWDVLGVTHTDLDVTDRDAVVGTITANEPDVIVHGAAYPPELLSGMRARIQRDALLVELGSFDAADGPAFLYRMR